MANKAAGWPAGADWGGLVVVGNILLPSRIFFLKINNFHSAVAIYNLYSENHKLLTLDTYTFLSNHNNHKCSYGLCFWASDPLIEGFY